jgi:hypothetical protein
VPRTGRLIAAICRTKPGKLHSVSCSSAPRLPSGAGVAILSSLATSGSYCSWTTTTSLSGTPKKRAANFCAASPSSFGSEIVAEVATQVVSSMPLPQNERSRRIRQAVSAPSAPRKVWASSKTRKSSRASSNSTTSFHRVSNSSICLTLVSRMPATGPMFATQLEIEQTLIENADVL